MIVLIVTHKERRTFIGRKKKIINNTNIPQHAIDTIARTIFPSILEYYNSKEGQDEFKKWKEEREKSKSLEADDK